MSMFLAVSLNKMHLFIIFQAWISPTVYFQYLQFPLFYKTKTDTNCLQQGDASIYRDKKINVDCFHTLCT